MKDKESPEEYKIYVIAPERLHPWINTIEKNP